MSLKDLDLNLQKHNPNHFQVLRGSLADLDFSLIADFIYDNGRPATAGTREIARKAGTEYEAKLRQLRKEDQLQEGYAILTEPALLPTGGVFHMVVPLVYHDEAEFFEFLWSCHWNCMVMAYDYLVRQKLPAVTLAFDVMEGLSAEASAHILRALCKLYRLYPGTRKIQVVFVCSDAVAYTNMKEAVHREKYR